MRPDALDQRVHAQLVQSGATGIDRAAVRAAVRSEAPLVGEGAAARVVDQVLARVRGLGPLDELLGQPELTEIMVNPDGSVWVEEEGRIRPTGERLAADQVTHAIERIVTPLGLRVDRSSPMVDARLPDGSRVNAVVPPLAIDGPALTIRRFGARAVDLSSMAPSLVVGLLRNAVAERSNLIISGGSGAGKTTVLNALAGSIPEHERVVTIEDAAELQLPGDHVVRLEARPPNLEGQGGITMRDLVHNALRMRPDRIIVGEVRGPECVDMLQALNTGHRGSLSTCHANSPPDALRRLETMALMAGLGLSGPAVRDHLHSAIDLVIQVARRADGSRVISQVYAVGDPGEPERGRVVADQRGVLP